MASRDSMDLPSFAVTCETVASQVSQRLPNPNPPAMKGESLLFERSLNLSFIAELIMSLRRSVRSPMVVLFISSGSGSLFQYAAMSVVVSSLSVMMPIIGSLFSGMRIISFSFGFSAAGMSANVFFIFASTSSTSKSPTTTSACMSGRYHV